jgi:hypothetical protein
MTIITNFTYLLFFGNRFNSKIADASRLSTSDPDFANVDAVESDIMNNEERKILSRYIIDQVILPVRDGLTAIRFSRK